MTGCDKLWLSVNRYWLLTLLLTAPLAVQIPLLSFVLLGLGLFLCGRSFPVFGPAETPEDALRFFSTMPFSRTQVFHTYIKCQLALCGAYAAVLAALRGLLALTGLPVYGWEPIGPSAWLLLLLLTGLILCLLLFLLMPGLWGSEYNLLLVLAITAAPMAAIGAYMAPEFLRIVTGLPHIRLHFQMDLNEAAALGWSKPVARTVAYAGALLIVTALLIVSYRPNKRRFCGEETP